MSIRYFVLSLCCEALQHQKRHSLSLALHKRMARHSFFIWPLFLTLHSWCIQPGSWPPLQAGTKQLPLFCLGHQSAELKGVKRVSPQRAFITCTNPAQSTGPDLAPPFEWNWLRAGQLLKVWHKSLVITSQPQELSHLFFGLGVHAGCDGCSSLQMRAQLLDS